MRVILISLLFSSALFAATPAEVCETVSRGNSFLGDSCYDVVDDALFSAEAVNLCAPLAKTNSYLAIECMKAIKLKNYDAREIRRCKSGNAYLLIQCLNKEGENVCK